MTPAEKAELYHELAKMIEADFHLDRSLTLLLKQRRSGRKHAFLSALQARLGEGQTVAEAVAGARSGEISAMEASMIDAGERSGRLGAAFGHLAHYFAAVETARREAWRAMFYPLVLLHLAILLPELPRAVASGQGNLAFKVAVAFGALWLSILGAFWLWRRLTAAAEMSATLDVALNRLPFIGRVRRHWALARFCQVFHAGLLAALRISRSVSLAGEASQSGRLRAATTQAAASIERGETVSASLREARAFDEDFLNSLATAEEVGALDDEMARWAARERDLATSAIQTASIWLPKIGYALIAAFVVYRIFGMVAGYYGGYLQQFDL
ncbi:MAG TPA: type II secretion system F family protein [Prosthecobacter sp.]|nr:type II secretion system F family protein [Prosthecobacter sp.]